MLRSQDVDSRISVHSKRFFRVVLESIDVDRESPESFALKLSLRTRTALPRVRQVVRRLPSAVKQGLSVDQANKLKVILEQLGGRVRLESYLETPGVDDPTPRAPTVHLGHDAEEVVVELRNCATCGRSLDEGSESCSFCHERMSPERVGEKADVPEDVPGESHAPAQSEETVLEEHPRAPLDLLEALIRNKLLIAAGILMILLAIAIIKQ